MTSNPANTALRGDDGRVLGYRACDGAILEEGAFDAPPQRRTPLQQVVHDTARRMGARLGLGWIGFLILLACFAPFLANSHPIIMKSEPGWSSPMLRHLEPVDYALPVTFICGVVLLIRRKLSIGRGLALMAWCAAVVYAAAIWPSVPQLYTSLHGLRGDLLPSWLAVGLLVGLGAVLALAIFGLPWLIGQRPAIIAGAALAPLVILLLIFPVRPPRLVVYDQYRKKQQSGEIAFAIRTIVPYSPVDRLRDLPKLRLKPPSLTNWAGTDSDGADMLSRMIHATRIALAIGFIATGLAVVIGITYGGLMGFFAGVIDLLGMRLIEIIDAIPRLLLLIAIAAAWGANIYLMMVVIGLLSWTGYARFIRAEFLKLRKLDFVHAATAAGLPMHSILFRHMLPNGVAPVLVSASFGVASAILMESTLSFLGLGLIDEPSWGQMLNQARSSGAGFDWWIATFPGLLIFLTVFAYNMIGEAIRDALDPKLLKRE